MKVETDLKAGALLQDAAQTVSSAANQVARVFSNASHQAASMTDKVLTKSTAVWNALIS
jgi:hypothetical protein